MVEGNPQGTSKPDLYRHLPDVAAVDTCLVALLAIATLAVVIYKHLR